jgi:hypothetical protein
MARRPRIFHLDFDVGTGPLGIPLRLLPTQVRPVRRTDLSRVASITLGSP